MKLLLVFISALVLVVAHGNIIRLQPGSPQELAGYSVEVADDAGPSVYAVQVSDPEAVRVFGAEEEQRAGFPQESQRAIENPEVLSEPLDVDVERAVPNSIFLPMTSSSCTNSACAYICSVLGFQNGNCVSINICNCYN